MFTTPRFDQLIGKIYDSMDKINPKTKTYLANAAGYPWYRTRLHGIQENYIRVINTDYYLPEEV
jgi:hypothetical protein